jgi:serine/threonine protein kinase
MKLCPSCEESYPDDAGFCPFDGSALVRGNDPLLGRTLAARYRLVRRLGTGGMAVVYLARHVMIERRNAIKILRQDLGMNPAHRERFLREARAVNRINHPNIVEITDFGEDAGLVFLVMEFIEGASLASIVRHNLFPWKRAARVGVQVASALARAHELGVIHRDLKPENVLLFIRDGADVVKLTDFGIAKIIDAPALTFSEQRFGTPGYMAPEYIEGAGASPRGDLYAFGVLLYELLTGHLPFDAKFPAEIFALQMTAPPIPPSDRVEGIPAPLEALILNLIERRPDDRPRDAFAACDALQEILAHAEGPSFAPAPETTKAVATFYAPGAPAPGSPAQPSAFQTVGAAPAREPQAESPHEKSAPSDPAHSNVASEIPSRWRASLAEFERQIEEARTARGDADPRVRRAADLVAVGGNLLASLERAAIAVSQYQTAVDDLEAEGREFRATLGHAIDTLSRDRSRELARLDTIARRRTALQQEAVAEGVDKKKEEATAWELAALTSEEARERALDVDLAYQIDTLEKQMNDRNEVLDGKLAEATARLEGALSAIRRITRELTRTREDAARALKA